MIVADTNLIAYFLIRSEHNELADRVHETDSIWVAPLLWRSEFHSVLAGYLRRGQIDLPLAEQTVERARVLMAEKEYQVPPAGVLDLVHRSGCSAYDCGFVALAQELSVWMVTSDVGVLSAFPDTAIPMTDFARGASRR